MTTPQIENGYVRIANEIMEKIASTKFNGSQFRILLAVWRYTYGFNRKHAEMSVSFLSTATAIDERQVRRELDRLISWKVLIEVKSPSKNTSREIGFNKYFDQWVIPPSGQIHPEGKQTQRGEGESTPSGEGEFAQRGEGEFTLQERQLKDNSKDNFKNNDMFPPPSAEPDKKLFEAQPVEQEIFNFWIQHRIMNHRSLTPKMRKVIQKAIRETSIEQVKTAIKHYAVMLHDKTCSWCDYAWGLDTFLSREKGYKYFLDDGEKWLNYLRSKGGRASPIRFDEESGKVVNLDAGRIRPYRG